MTDRVKDLFKDVGFSEDEAAKLSLAWAASSEKRPKKRGWVERSVPPEVYRAATSTAISGWTCGPIFVLSTLAEMDMPDGDGTGPTWLVTISANRQRPAQWQVDKVLADFDMLEAEEDNHAPGRTRGFFLVVDPARRVPCPCKDEELVTEPDGFTWARDTSGQPCIGCLTEAAFGMPCPEHSR
jgi:hypothetical protein